MANKGQDIVSVIKQQMESFGTRVTMVDTGVVIQIGDGVARVHGLSSCRSMELLEFPNSVFGIALNLEEDSVGVVILGDERAIKEGDEVKTTGRIVEVPVGNELLGRVVDPLGRPIDGKGPIRSEIYRPIERVAPDVSKRSPVNIPMQTGIKAIDAMTPIGRGQRQLIIGDRSTGKSQICIDAIINQKGQNVQCVYVAIGQKASKVAEVVGTLERFGAMEHTVVVAANAADSAALQWLAPYAGCAIAEQFMEGGGDALIVYDDLSKHSWAYRQVSLLLRRPAGREAYPGDVFYLHSRLLERAAKLDAANGGGSITALPIIETQAGDVSAYIPTNVISITDGQIYLEADLFNSGTRPAVNAGLSVSRVGGAAQRRAIKRVAGRIRLDLSQYRELAAFAQFGTSDLDKATLTQIERGQRTIEILKQGINEPIPMEKQALILYVVTNGYLDNVPLNVVSRWESEFQRFMQANHPDVANGIRDTNDLEETQEEILKKGIEEFTASFSA
jgi:F-type H+-transporting ATPase subunit alpha